MKKSDIAIIIPCYNDGAYLTSAVESVFQYKGALQLEVLVVNDGSTDEQTIKVINELKDNYPLTIINQNNKRMAAARNEGVKASTAPFFIPLDADDLLNVEVIEKAFELMNTTSKIGVVYGNCEYIGEKSGVDNKQFNVYAQLYVNTINITTLIKKQVWEQCGGFDENMKDGYEDWEFWINVIKHNWEFKKVDMVAFYYRIKKQSTNVDAIKKHEQLLTYIQHKHIDLFNKKYIELNRTLHNIKNNRKLLLKYLINNILGKSN